MLIISKTCINDTSRPSVVPRRVILSLKILLMVDLQPDGSELQLSCATLMS